MDVVAIHRSIAELSLSCRNALAYKYRVTAYNESPFLSLSLSLSPLKKTMHVLCQNVTHDMYDIRDWMIVYIAYYSVDGSGHVQLL